MIDCRFVFKIILLISTTGTSLCSIDPRSPIGKVVGRGKTSLSLIRTDHGNSSMRVSSTCSVPIPYRSVLQDGVFHTLAQRADTCSQCAHRDVYWCTASITPCSYIITNIRVGTYLYERKTSFWSRYGERRAPVPLDVPGFSCNILSHAL